MEYHGMGTRSWSSLLTLKSFIGLLASNAEKEGSVYRQCLLFGFTLKQNHQFRKEDFTTAIDHLPCDFSLQCKKTVRRLPLSKDRSGCDCVSG
jgi:hypothetical protein